jgi:hypothetical protein
MRLKKWLEARQYQLRESNAQFARRLGVTPQFWGLIRRGEQRVTLRIARAAWRAFPEDRSVICDLALGDPADDSEQSAA